MIEAFKIILLAIVAAIFYGIVHDQVTARVCVEYFTVGHPRLFDTDDPTLLALCWGVVATWWVGAILGVPAAALARLGGWPKLGAEQLVKPILGLLLMMSVSALAFGAAGYYLSRSGQIALPEALAARLDPSRYDVFMADAAAHLASYGVGFLGGLVLWIWIPLKRLRMSKKL